MIRVLVTDDSATSRLMLAEILRRDPQIEIVGEACDGLEAVRMVQELKPDLVTMDVYMPKMDGFQATKEIMITAPAPIVIVTGHRDVKEVEKAMASLRAGALAVLQKPRGPSSPEFEESSQRLIAAVKTMSQVRVVRHWRTQSSNGAPAPQPPRTLPNNVALSTGIVTIVASTGGPAALEVVLSEFPKSFPWPILVVQHISLGFTDGLVQWLGQSSKLRVNVATSGDVVKAGNVYFAPEGQQMGIHRDGRVMLSNSDPIGGFRPSGTFLFQSAAAAYGSSTIAIIMTGMGDDGVAGLRAVRSAGGRVIAQDAQSCVVYGMPAVAAASGCVDAVVPLDNIAQRVIDWVAKPSLRT